MVRMSPVALVQKVAQQLDRHRNGEPYPVIALGAQPVWPHDPDLVLPDGRRVRVVPCVSPLAIWEQVVAERGEQVLVLLTDVPESDLGAGLRSRLFRQRIIAVQPWDLVVEAFGAQLPDAALEAEEWAGEALLEAMPAGGWPKLTGSVLSRDVALRHLAAVRLGLDRLGAAPDDLDVALLLRWSALPGATEAFGLLRPAERDGLARWLASRFGRPAKALFALVGAGHGADALPLGLVCDALWSTDTPDALRARGRVDQYFGHSVRDDQTIQAFSEAAVQVVSAMLAAPTGDAATRRQGHAVLDRAEELLVQFGATGCAGHSSILRSGFTHRLSLAADALLAALQRPDDTALDAAVDNLAAHRLAHAEAERVRRVRMAQRLVRWLGTQVEPPRSVADGVDRQIAEWGWVDLALSHVWAGEDVHPGLQAAFREVYDRASHRRRDLDRVFAQRLAAWIAAGPGNDGDLLTVETLLPRVVEPLLRAGRPTLLVVLDGMSAAVAVELADELSQHWVEYDPIAAGGPARRRGVVAALPTLTAVSRTSLFAGTLREGNQETERQIFAQGRWGKHAHIFHKGPSRGAAGEVLAPELVQAIADPQQFVAVVLNTVDESLTYGREGDEAGWQIGDIAVLRSLLDLARSAGRAVIITSDHGHVLDRGAQQVRVADAASARHRVGGTPAGPGEIELAGPRVVADDNRIVALWDPQLRYRPAKAGYHGGASLAEVTIPLLAFLLPNVTDTPTGWSAVETREPDWWQPGTPPAVAAPGSTPPSTPAVPKPRRRVPTVDGDTLFDVPPAPAQTAAEPAAGDSHLVDALLATELFQAQQALTPRRLPTAKIQAALAALLHAGGVLPTAVLAERAGESPARAAGFVTTLQRIFNVDNYPVLVLADGGRTVRLDVRLLREQFNLPGGRP
jgi:hypothetical protein